MHKDAKIVKERLTGYYDREAVAYHETFYRRPGPYSPLQYRQWYVEEMIDTVAPKGAKILDVGCGPGQLLLSLMRKGYDAYGIDISQGMVEVASALLEENGFASKGRVALGDIEGLNFPDASFDVVVAAGVIEYQKRDDEALHEMRRVLKDRGHLILNVNNRLCYLGMLYGPYRWLKQHRWSRSLLNILKEKVLRKGKLHDLPDRRVHSPRLFDRQLASIGLHKVSHNYFHFSPLPIPIDSALSGLCRPVGRWLERLTVSPVAGWLAGGYLVMARKVASD